ncbi:MAG TPA: type 1 glutamine amidotransferase domain-containing protein [Candidatus Limnocylindrales bacterium]|nr:type 1 glutamine amidotransferase domain-containing protein [Candidatus Limnocylindrales bacterium]
MHELDSKRIAFLATDGVQADELQQPWDAADDAGATMDLLSVKEGQIQGVRGMDRAQSFAVDRQVGDARADDYDALVLPGGVANPDRLRTHPEAVNFVRDFFVQAKPVAAICHGPWMLVEADVVRGRTLTSWPSLRTDIENAGGHWVDEMVHVDRGLVTSRKPDDLPAFCRKMVEEFAEGRHPAQARATAAAAR